MDEIFVQKKKRKASVLVSIKGNQVSLHDSTHIYLLRH